MLLVLEGLERQAQHMLRMSIGVLGLVVVQVDEQGIELGEPADQPAMAEEAVLGQVDVGFARELPGRIGKVGDRHRLSRASRRWSRRAMLTRPRPAGCRAKA